MCQYAEMCEGIGIGTLTMRHRLRQLLQLDADLDGDGSISRTESEVFASTSIHTCAAASCMLWVFAFLKKMSALPEAAVNSMHCFNRQRTALLGNFWHRQIRAQ